MKIVLKDKSVLSSCVWSGNVQIDDDFFVCMSINAFMEVAANVTNISCITQVTLKFINQAMLVNSGSHEFSNFKVFVEFFTDDHRMNCGLDLS